VASGVGLDQCREFLAVSVFENGGDERKFFSSESGERVLNELVVTSDPVEGIVETISEVLVASLGASKKEMLVFSTGFFLNTSVQ